MYILGLNYGEFNTSCAIIKNGKLLFALQEERCNREKFSKQFPIRSIEYILKKFKIKIGDVYAITSGWNPAGHLTKYNPLISKHRNLRENNYYTLTKAQGSQIHDSHGWNMLIKKIKIFEKLGLYILLINCPHKKDLKFVRKTRLLTCT